MAGFTLQRGRRLEGAAPVLDDAQGRVASHREGPLLVLAGPGTGKTTTLVEAVVRRIREQADQGRTRVPLVLTFCPPDRRARDLDGLLSSCKASLDGVAHALGVNDARFEPLTLRRGRVVKGGVVVLEVGQ